MNSNFEIQIETFSEHRLAIIRATLSEVNCLDEITGDDRALLNLILTEEQQGRILEHITAAELLAIAKIGAAIGTQCIESFIIFIPGASDEVQDFLLGTLANHLECFGAKLHSVGLNFEPLPEDAITVVTFEGSPELCGESIALTAFKSQLRRVWSPSQEGDDGIITCEE